MSSQPQPPPSLISTLLHSSIRLHRSRYNLPSLVLVVLITSGCISTLLAILLVSPSPVPQHRHRVIAFLPFSVIIFTCWWLLWSFRTPVIGDVSDDAEGGAHTHAHAHARADKRGPTWRRHPPPTTTPPQVVTLPAAIAGRHGRGRDSAGMRLVVPSVRSRSGSGSTDATVVGVGLSRETTRTGGGAGLSRETTRTGGGAGLSRETTRSQREQMLGRVVVNGLKRGGSTASRNTTASAKERLEVNTGGLSRTMSTRSDAPGLPTYHSLSRWNGFGPRIENGYKTSRYITGTRNALLPSPQVYGYIVRALLVQS
ncbi:hypothetical protein BZA05DRAFT_416809 [Tricharina praecox]|uniref:uncharacterized protein n=1 Tax=Tricharina praecox TaxID=43433 RepID=UPI002220F08A|nr:uncharacterized protein BZA05DRAFT_416809 [Tricharina praecox]KAI5855211.1 hypothetical protein BZA05DRAFT_416809 [Tricharina praecox]